MSRNLRPGETEKWARDSGENGQSDLRWGVAILDKRVIKADAWLCYNWYGLKASQDMVGRDATDEVTTIVLLRPQRSTLLTGRQATFSKESANNDLSSG